MKSHFLLLSKLRVFFLCFENYFHVFLLHTYSASIFNPNLLYSMSETSGNIFYLIYSPQLPKTTKLSRDNSDTLFYENSISQPESVDLKSYTSPVKSYQTHKDPYPIKNPIRNPFSSRLKFNQKYKKNPRKVHALFVENLIIQPISIDPINHTRPVYSIQVQSNRIQ